MHTEGRTGEDMRETGYQEAVLLSVKQGHKHQSVTHPHLDPIQHSPDHRGNARCGLSLVMSNALQHHLIGPVNQLSHRLVKTTETGGDGLTAGRTGRDRSGDKKQVTC